MTLLKQKLSSEIYDLVRLSLGLKPLSESSKLGEKISDSVRESLNSKL